MRRDDTTQEEWSRERGGEETHRAEDGVKLSSHVSSCGAENGKNPVLAMKDESTGDRYLRAVGKKGVGYMEWLIKDLHMELKPWGHMGGASGNINKDLTEKHRSWL